MYQLFLIFFGILLFGSDPVSADNLKQAEQFRAEQFRAEQLRKEGLEYRSQGDLKSAIAALGQSVSLAPSDPNGYVILGWTQHLAGMSESAANSLWQAIWLKPQLVAAANALGIVYLVSGELDTAILIHQWAGFWQPNNEIAYYNLSLAYQQQRQFGLAIAYAKLAAKLEPQNPHPLVSLAISHWEDQDQINAKTAFQAAINLDSRYSDRQFLDFLNEAGFNSAQILTAKSVLDTL